MSDRPANRQRFERQKGVWGGVSAVLERGSRAAALWTGSSVAFGLATLVVLVWVATGPVFHYSDTWQLVINTGTTVITFLMVFLIQRSQNKDALAVQLKLNELLAALEGASNRLVGVEELTEDELAALRTHYQKLAELAKNDMDLLASHSIDEAHARHKLKGIGRREATREEGAAVS